MKTTTHIGKIGRLRRHLRDELGIRLEDGQDGQTILDWLNAKSEVQMMLKDYFEGRPITAQNLSEWRQTGHQEWLRQQETIGYVNQLCEQGQAMDTDEYAESVSDRLAAVLAGELMRTAEELRAATKDPKERWEQLCALNRELERLRKQDHRAKTLRVARERWEMEMERTLDADWKQDQKEVKAEALAQILTVCDRNNEVMKKGGKELAKNADEALFLMKCGKNWLETLEGLFPMSRKEEWMPKHVLEKYKAMEQN